MSKKNQKKEEIKVSVGKPISIAELVDIIKEGQRVYGKAKKSVDLEKVRAITELCTNCVRDYRYCDVCLEVFGEVI